MMTFYILPSMKSTFLNCILYILFLSCTKKMTNPKTGRIITRMTNFLPFWNFSMNQKPSKTMNKFSFELSIAFSI